MKSGQIVSLLKQIYSQTSPRIANHLVDPNLVLVMAGLKGQSESDIFLKEEEDSSYVKELKDLNHFFLTFGLRAMTGRAFEYQGKRKTTIKLESLEGHRRVSLNPIVPGTEVLQTNANFSDLDAWKRQSVDLLEKQIFEGKLNPKWDVGDLVAGWFYGYPKQAVLDVVENYSLKLDRHQMSSMMWLSDFYPCLQPGFEFFPEHFEEIGIKTYILDCEKILADFYSSPWHRKHMEEILKIKLLEEKAGRD